MRLIKFEPLGEEPIEVIARRIGSIDSTNIFITSEGQFLLERRAKTPTGYVTAACELFDDAGEFFEHLTAQLEDDELEEDDGAFYLRVIELLQTEEPDPFIDMWKKWRIEQEDQRDRALRVMTKLLAQVNDRVEKLKLLRTRPADLEKQHLELLSKRLRLQVEGFIEKDTADVHARETEALREIEKVQAELGMASCGFCWEWYKLPGPNPDMRVCDTCVRSENEGESRATPSGP